MSNENDASLAVIQFFLFARIESNSLMFAFICILIWFGWRMLFFLLLVPHFSAPIWTTLTWRCRCYSIYIRLVLYECVSSTQTYTQIEKRIYTIIQLIQSRVWMKNLHRDTNFTSLTSKASIHLQLYDTLSTSIRFASKLQLFFSSYTYSITYACMIMLVHDTARQLYIHYKLYIYSIKSRNLIKSERG